MVASIANIGYRAAATSEVWCLNVPRLWKANGVTKGIIALHGHGGNWTQWQQDRTGYNNVPSAGGHQTALVNAGYLVASIDAGGPTSWGCAASQDAMTSAYNDLINGGYIAGTKIGLIVYSMGGLIGLNWLANNASKVACVWAFTPGLDLQYFYNEGGSYQSEITAALNGASIATYSPQANASAYTALKVPLSLYVGSNDTTVPPAQSANFVTAANNPNWSRTEVAGYDHLSVFDAMSTSTVTSFFAAHL